MNRRLSSPQGLRSRWFAALAVAVSLAACDKTGPQVEQPATIATAPADVRLGTYRVVLQLPDSELPFGLELAREGDAVVAFLINGPERVRVPDTQIKGTSLAMEFPGYSNRVLATATATGLSGELIMVRRGGTEARIPLTATFGTPWRFFAQPSTDNADVAGRWAVQFMNPDGTPGEAAVAELTQTHAIVTGTFLAPSGDHRFIAGEVHGDELYLSRFDGGSAFLYRAKIGKDGSLSGSFHAGNWAQSPWVAKRDPDAALPDPATLSHLKHPGARIDFTFPDLDGKPVSLSDRRFAGKVVVLTLGGSWCPNCHDEAEFLQPFYAARQERGLEVVQLLFEHFGDFAQAAVAGRRFRDAYGIQFPVLIAGTSNRDDVAAKFPQLDRIYAYPTTLVIDRQGQVRQVHTGFSGPATGVHYEDWQREFSALIDGLLAKH